MQEKMKILGNNFKLLRRLNGYTQQQMADFLGVERSCLARFELGERGINVSALEKACTLFGCTLKELEEYKDKDLSKPLHLHRRDLTTDDLNAIVKVLAIVRNLGTMKKIEFQNCKEKKE